MELLEGTEQNQISKMVMSIFTLIIGAVVFLILSVATLARRAQIRHEARNLLRTEIPTSILRAYNTRTARNIRQWVYQNSMDLIEQRDVDTSKASRRMDYASAVVSLQRFLESSSLEVQGAPASEGLKQAKTAYYKICEKAAYGGVEITYDEFQQFVAAVCTLYAGAVTQVENSRSSKGNII